MGYGGGFFCLLYRSIFKATQRVVYLSEPNFFLNSEVCDAYSKHGETGADSTDKLKETNLFTSLMRDDVWGPHTTGKSGLRYKILPRY